MAEMLSPDLQVMEAMAATPRRLEFMQMLTVALAAMAAALFPAPLVMAVTAAPPVLLDILATLLAVPGVLAVTPCWDQVVLAVRVVWP